MFNYIHSLLTSLLFSLLSPLTWASEFGAESIRVALNFSSTASASPPPAPPPLPATADSSPSTSFRRDVQKSSYLKWGFKGFKRVLMG